MKYEPSELIINADGSVFHLHVLPEYLADRVILVGDPGRVDLVSRHFDKVEYRVENREFRTVTGTYHGKRITVVSTGIGCDNIDIVVNELDALANINFETRDDNPEHRTLTIVRVGTCGGMQRHTPVGTYIVSEKSLGFDGLLNFYGRRNEVCDLEFERIFKDYMKWEGSQCIAYPYAVDADPELTDRICQDDMVRGITIACCGFYGPQGRLLRAPLADPSIVEKIWDFRYKPQPGQGTSECFTNFEMESSAVAGLSRLLGHKATTVCMVIASRFEHEANTNYKSSMDDLICKVLDRI